MNRSRLYFTTSWIGQILQIANVGNYWRCVNYRYRISEAISEKVSDKMVSLADVYLQWENTFRNKEKHLYEERLADITDVTQFTVITRENALTGNQLKFWFQHIIPLIFDENRNIQESAVRAVEAALPFIQPTSHQEHPDWSALERRITTEYANQLPREMGDSLSYKIWNIVVKLLDKKLWKIADVMRKFLSFCERGFRSTTTRAETFCCWKVLVETFFQDAQQLARRIKVILAPFKQIATTPQIAVNKFNVWWSLICKVDNHINQYYDTILEPFLSFCFGLSDQPILTRTDDSRQEIYPQLTTKTISALIVLLGPVFSDAASALCKSPPLERIREPLATPELLEKVGRLLINSCGEATFLLREMELVDAIPKTRNF